MINKLISILIFQFIFLLGNVIAENNSFQATVQIEEVINIEISPSIWVSGNVISQYDSKISSEVEGRIVSILEIGDYVKTGDIIGKIENTRYQLNYAEIQAEIQPIKSLLQFYTNEAERLNKLTKKNNAAKNQLEQIQANKNEAIAKIKLIKSKMATAYDLINRTIIKAPFDGVITDRYKSIGERVDLNNEIVRLVNTQSLEIQSYIQQESLAYIQAGDSLEIKVDSSIVNGVVSKVIPVADSISKLYEIRIQFDDQIWPVGTAVKVASPINKRQNVLAVSRDALVIRQSGVVIYRINQQNRAELIPVNTGISNATHIQVIGNISLNDKIVVRGNERLRPNQSVKVINDLDR